MATTSRRPTPALLAVTAGSVVAFFGLAAIPWGSFRLLWSNPWRGGALALIGLAAAASLFSGIHLGGCVRADARDRWRLAPLAGLSLALAVGPGYDDRLGWLPIGGGDLVRGLGLGMTLAGSVLRVGPMFVLGRRFTWPLASQPSHRLETTGFYRYVRHPSYIGAFLGGIGWALVFRSGLGLILMALLLPAFLPVAIAEETLLEAEFGEVYRDYRRKTWRLIPFVY